MLRHTRASAAVPWSLALCLALAPAVVLSTTVVAAAEDEAVSEADKARALALYDQGAAAYAQARYHDAVDSFLRADRIVQNPAFAYNIALAYRQVGDVPNALRWGREFLHRDPAAERAAEISELVADMEARLSERGLQQLTVRSEPSGATLAIDGRAVGVTPWTGELTPGEHDIELRRDGFSRKLESLTLPAEKAIGVAYSLEVAPPEPTPAPSPVLPSPSPAPPAPAHTVVEPSIGPWTWVALGLGVAGVGAGIGLEVARSGAEDAARDAPTQLDALAEAERMQDFERGAQIAVGLGAGFVAVGGLLMVLDLTGVTAGSDDAEQACRAGGCTATWRF